MTFADKQGRWVELAETLKPELHRIEKRPLGLVSPVSDALAFQGWRMQPEEGLAALPERILGRGDSFTLDFGEHLVGYLEFSISSTKSFLDSPVRLKFVFGEAPVEVAEPFDPYSGALSRAWLQDEIINIDILPQTISLPRRYAFRYLKITVVDTSPSFKVQISDIKCKAVSSASFDPNPIPGEARSAETAALDTVALQTLRNCMHTVFEDGPKRDRRLWLGDLKLQALTNYVSYRNFDLVKRCLYLFAGFARENGVVPACVYEVPQPHDGQLTILDYAALFGPTLLNYAQAGEDWDTAEDLWPVALKQMEIVLQYVNAEGLFIDPGNWWIFIDWNNKLDKQASVQGILIHALQQTFALAAAIDREHEAAHLAPVLDNMVDAARRILWDADRQVIVSGNTRQVSWASQAWMIIAGVLDGDEGAAALRAVMNSPEAQKPAGPYLYHYVVEAMLLCEMESEAAELLKSYWGGMIKRGATTFWEVYDPKRPTLSPYNSHQINSYCHAWSCTPSYFIRTFPEVFS